MDILLMEANRIGAEVIDDLTALACEEMRHKQNMKHYDKVLQENKEKLQKIEEERIRIEEERIEIEEQKARNKVWRQNKDAFEKLKTDIVDEAKSKKRTRLTAMEKYARRCVAMSLSPYKYCVAKSVHYTPEPEMDLELEMNISLALENKAQDKGMQHE